MGRQMLSFTSTVVGVLMLTIVSMWSMPGSATAQMNPFQQEWRNQELARQMNERQQWLQWQQQEQARQMAERQNYMEWQQQEKVRRMFQ